MANVISNYVKFRRGNPEAFKNLAHKEPDTLYFIYEEDALNGELYLGEKLIAGAGEINGATSLRGLLDTYISDKINADSFLVYDIAQGKWVDKPVEDILSAFVGTAGDRPGITGLVPAPDVGEGNYFLRGDGTWAEVVTASAAKVYQTIKVAEESVADAISRVLTSTPDSGDIVIVKELIVDDKYQYTSYVFNGESWMAMDGNYNANDVYFDNDLIFTYAFGKYVPDSTGNVKVPAKGLNLKALLENAYAIEDNSNLIKSYPTVNISGEIKYYEIGTSGTQEIIVFLNDDGEYKYGYSADPINGYSGDQANQVTSNGNTGVVVDMNVSNPYKLLVDGSFISPVQDKGEKFILSLEPKTSKAEVKVQGAITHSQGYIPVSNFGKLYPDQRIVAGEKTSLALPRARWYLPMFQGFTYADSVIVDLNTMTADSIEQLSAPLNSTVGSVKKVINENAYNKVKIISATAEKPWRQYFLIIPKEYDWKMKNAKDSNNIDCTIKQGKDITISFGADNNTCDVIYSVYYINNAADYGTLTINWDL